MKTRTKGFIVSFILVFAMLIGVVTIMPMTASAAAAEDLTQDIVECAIRSYHRIDDPGRRIVTKVNGEEVKGLAHLYSLLYPENGQSRPDFTVIEFADAARPMVIDNTTLDAANERISRSYGIPAPARLSSSLRLLPCPYRWCDNGAHW